MRAISDKIIAVLYKDLLLPWEGGLSKKQFPAFDVLKDSLPDLLKIEPVKKLEQMFVLEKNWKPRKDQYLVVAKGSGNKAHLLMRMLRNSFAHGHMTACQINKVKMIGVRHMHNGNLLMFGQMTEYSLQVLISSIALRVK